MPNDLSRRDVLWMSAIAAAAFTPIGRAVAAETRLVDAGELAKYADEGIYPEFQPSGFFVIRRGDRVVAQSSICTHKRCKLKATGDGFSCGCHGSKFTVDGKVSHPPAVRDLPRHQVALSETGHLLVDTSKIIQPSDFESAGAYLEVPAAK